ncbi:MAG: hypothetical protein SGILL_003045 [Bacillariaceae sp.]
MVPPTVASTNFTLQPFYQNPLILEQKCSVTVLLVDPDLEMDTMWALESVAANILPLETTCILLKTSICGKGKSSRDAYTGFDVQERYRQKADRVRKLARPLLANLIDRGNVRMTILNHTHYNLRACDNFYNPSFMLENFRFWGSDEFDEDLDSDLVLMTQGDAVLCHELHVDKWRDVAWVGAPWPARTGDRPWHFCSSLATIWREGHLNVNADEEPPPYPTPEQMCSNTMVGPQGNGGLGLRSRKWLRKAIEYCPSIRADVSGLSPEQYAAAPCRAQNAPAEDIYFVSILRGIGAPIPSNYEAALFSLELKSPGMIADQYKLNATFMEEMVRKRWYSRNDATGMDHYQKMIHHENTTKDPLIPIGIHKPWNDHVKEQLGDEYLNEQCPYMRKVVENSKYGRIQLSKLKIPF